MNTQRQTASLTDFQATAAGTTSAAARCEGRSYTRERAGRDAGRRKGGQPTDAVGRGTGFSPTCRTTTSALLASQGWGLAASLWLIFSQPLVFRFCFLSFVSLGCLLCSVPLTS